MLMCVKSRVFRIYWVIRLVGFDLRSGYVNGSESGSVNLGVENVMIEFGFEGMDVGGGSAINGVEWK